MTSAYFGANGRRHSPALQSRPRPRPRPHPAQRTWAGSFRSVASNVQPRLVLTKQEFRKFILSGTRTALLQAPSVRPWIVHPETVVAGGTLHLRRWRSLAFPAIRAIYRNDVYLWWQLDQQTSLDLSGKIRRVLLGQRMSGCQERRDHSMYHGSQFSFAI